MPTRFLALSIHACSLPDQLWHRVASEATRRAFLTPTAHCHQAVAVGAHAASNQEVALDVPFLVSGPAAKHIDAIRINSFNHFKLPFAPGAEVPANPSLQRDGFAAPEFKR